MSLAEQIQSDLTAAMKARDKVRTATLRLVLAGIKNVRAEPGHGQEVTDEEVRDIVGREAKKRRESVQTYTDAGRDELAATEQAELEVLTDYLPEQMSEEEVRDLVEQTVADVDATGPADLGKVMGALMPKVKGTADGKMVNRVVRDALDNT